VIYLQKRSSFGKSQLLTGVKLANQNQKKKIKWREISKLKQKIIRADHFCAKNSKKTFLVILKH